VKKTKEEQDQEFDRLRKEGYTFLSNASRIKGYCGQGQIEIRRLEEAIKHNTDQKNIITHPKAYDRYGEPLPDYYVSLWGKNLFEYHKVYREIVPRQPQNKETKKLPKRKENPMSTRTFLVVSSWAWDHDHISYATFDIEEYEDSPFYYKPLTPKDMRKYVDRYINLPSKIKGIINAADGSIMGSAEGLALFEVEPIHRGGFQDRPMDEEIRTNIVKVDIRAHWLCDLNHESYSPIFT